MSSRNWLQDGPPDPPKIDDEMPLSQVIQVLYQYLMVIIDVPHSFEELRSAVYGHALAPLVDSLNRDVHHPAILPALLALRGHFIAHDENDNRHLSLTRAYACEITAWRFTACLSERETIDYLLYELPAVIKENNNEPDLEASDIPGHPPVRIIGTPTERTRLLGKERDAFRSPVASLFGNERDIEEQHFIQLAASFAGLNALEIATVSDCKKFLSQRPVQKIVDGIWDGTYVFWETLNADSRKKPVKYNKSRADPYCRLRVPKYLKVFEVFFFLVFLGLYYAVLMHRNPHKITIEEILLLIWIASFAYNELGEYFDAGLRFYATDFWSIWDTAIVAIACAYFITRAVGLIKHDYKITDTAFDILSLEALLLFPRISSVLSLNQFFGTLIPCLREMTKYSTKFLVLVIIVYLGFLTTFTLLARDIMPATETAWLLVKVFFGSSYLGLDTADKISPVLGTPLMLIFLWLTNFLLITTLISILSNSLSEVMNHAREEYLFQYSVFVLEASTSNRLTYFLPPMNLIALMLRPCRLFMSGETLRTIRITLLKLTHFPCVMLIEAWENLFEKAPVRFEKSSWAKMMEGPKSRRQPLSVINRNTQAVSPYTDATKSRRGYPFERSASSPSMNPAKRGATNIGHEGQMVVDRDMQRHIVQLTEQIEKLTAKVDDLVAVVGKQQEVTGDAASA